MGRKLLNTTNEKRKESNAKPKKQFMRKKYLGINKKPMRYQSISSVFILNLLQRNYISSNFPSACSGNFIKPVNSFSVMVCQEKAENRILISLQAAVGDIIGRFIVS